MSLSQQKTPAAVDALREHLARGGTGRLVLQGRSGLRVYCMQGEVLAAHAASDGTWMVRRLVNNGAITERQGRAFTRSVEQGRSAEELLVGHVPDALFHGVLESRFRQNLFDFLLSSEPATYTAMDAVFVSNVQVGHDTASLIDGLLALRERILPLLTRTSPLTLARGPSLAGSKDEARLMDLCEPPISLPDLVNFSPFEEAETLDAVVRMLETGALVSKESLRLLRRDSLPPEVPTRARPPVQEYAVEELFSIDDLSFGDGSGVGDAEPVADGTPAAEGLSGWAGTAAPSEMEELESLPPGFMEPYADEQASLQPVESATLSSAPEPVESAALPVDPEPVESAALSAEPEPMGATDPAPADPMEPAVASDDAEPSVAWDASEPAEPSVAWDASAASEPAEPSVAWDASAASEPAEPSVAWDASEPAEPAVAWDDPDPAEPPTSDFVWADDEISGLGAQASGSDPAPAAVPDELQTVDLTQGAPAPAGPLPAEADSESVVEPTPVAPPVSLSAPPEDAPPQPASESVVEPTPVSPPVSLSAPPEAVDEQPDAAPAAAPEPSADAAPAAGAPDGPAEDAPDPDAAFEPGQAQHEPTASELAFFAFDEDVEDAELAMFSDQDHLRGGGQGQFTLGTELLDVVDLGSASRAPAPVGPPADEEADLVLEAIGVEDTELTEEDLVVALSFGAPKLSEEELHTKLDVCNSVLREVCRGVDRTRGGGAGVASVQLLLDGSPSHFGALFHGLSVDEEGAFSQDSAVENLSRRPESERRSLLDRAVMDLIERALSLAVEELPDAEVDALLQRIAGYQQRLRG